MIYTEKYIKEKIEEIKKEISKKYLKLQKKIDNKTISSEDLLNNKEYFSNYIKSKFNINSYNIYEFINTVENINEYIRETMIQWPNLETSDKFVILNDEIYEKIIKLHDKETIIFDEIFLFFQNKFGDSATYCMLYKDYLRGNITLEQLLKILNLKKAKND